MADSHFNEVLRAVEREEERAKTKLAWYKLSGFGGCRKDVVEAVALLEERERAEDGEAMWMLGICKEYGIGTEQDLEGAEKLYEQSSERGNETGMFLASNGGDGSGSMKIGGLLKKTVSCRFISVRFQLCHDFKGGDFKQLGDLLKIAPWYELSLKRDGDNTLTEFY